MILKPQTTGAGTAVEHLPTICANLNLLEVRIRVLLCGVIPKFGDLLTTTGQSKSVPVRFPSLKLSRTEVVR
jgi:hypothetical protein